MSNLEKVCGWIDAHRGEAIDFLAELVKIPSVNPWFSNYNPYTTEKDVQLFLADRLRELGFDVELWEVDPDELKRYEGMPGYYEGRPMRDRPNLCAIRRGTGGGRSLLLTGHPDVVKEGEGWTRDPFGAQIENGRMFGRGTVDMKGGIAAMIMAVKAILESGVRLKGDVIVGTTPDEEAGGMGALDFVHRPGFSADGAIMTEPTYSRGIGSMCRGILWGKIVIPARAGHIEMEQQDWRQGGAVDGVKLAQLYLAQIDQFNTRWAARKKHPLLPMPCQLTVAQVVAGEYPSAYAGFAEISFDAQYLPEDLDEKYRGSRIKKEIEDFVSAVAETDAWLRENPPHVEWLLDADCAETPADGAFVQTLLGAANKLSGKVEVVGLGSHSDMGWFAHTGIPIVNFGPGDPMLAHQADESIELDDYINCTEILASMILDWCGAEE